MFALYFSSHDAVEPICALVCGTSERAVALTRVRGGYDADGITATLISGSLSAAAAAPLP